MGKLKRLISILGICLCTSAVFAKQICFQVVQHDESAEEVTEQSLTIEDEVLNKFFDYGFIVTNSTAAVSSSDGMDEKLFKNGVGEAFNGYSDYFVQINLFFEKTENTTASNADLTKINYTLAAANSGVKIAAKSIDNIKLDHKKDDLKKISSTLVSDIYKTIIANKDKVASL